MKKLSVVWAMVFFLLLPLALSASSYSSIVAFGDSLSDNGYLEDGYGFGTYSNGDVWVEYLADSDHLNCNLYDYAFGGALTGYENITAGLDYTGMNWQVDQYLANQFAGAPAIGGDVLYTVWAGGNDFLNLSADATYEEVEDTITSAVFNIVFALTKLVGAGAENILVINLPNLGATPAYNTNPVAAAGAQYITNAFNTALGTALGGFELMEGLNFYSLDAYGILGDIIDDPDCYGFDNVTEMLSIAGATTEDYLFWDGVHPTTQAHEMLAGYALEEVAPVPEPGTMILLGAGLVGIAGFRKKLQRIQ